MNTQNLIWVDGVAYKLVPIEPTEEMIEAVCTGDESQPGKSAYEVISERYKAMLEAAPEPKEYK